MIVDHISNLDKYVSLSKEIQTVVDYIKQTNLITIEPGKYDVVTNRVKLLRENYVARPQEECFFESHQLFGDIQLVLKGEEYFGYMPKDTTSFKVTHEYDQDKDVLKGQATSDFTRVLLTEGMFALVLKYELHMPKLENKPNTEVIKAVFKIKLSEGK